MTFLSKLKDALADRAAEAVAASLTVLLVWAAYQLSPAVLPAMAAAASKQVLLALLISSFALNLIFLLVIWLNTKADSLRLKYGVYWDKQKNPHCPSCKKPISGFNDYGYGGKGYFCTPCDKVIPLTDVHGKNIDPAYVINEL